jgi:cytochrome P450
MPYIDQVIHEALRMHPPAVFVNRICTEDIKLEYEGRKATVFKDMNILIPIYQIHYDSEHYEDPESFKPERFDAEVGGLKKYKDKGVYLPFGDGPRICLGMKFALMQSKAAIAAIIKNFVISVNEKTADKMVLEAKEFLNVKVGGLWLDFKPIEA